MAEIVELLAEVVGGDNVLTGDEVHSDYAHDEALTAAPSLPLAVVRPRSTAEVAAVLRIADELHVPVTARGSGTGLSGAAISPPDGILVSFERMNAILEIDLDNHVAVVQPGVTLEAAQRAPWPTTGSCTPSSPASRAPRSGATWPPTPAACGPSSTA